MKKIFKEHDLLKIVLGMILFVVLLSWIIPTGTYATGAEFSLGARERIGLIHIFYGFSYAIQNFSIQIVYLIVVGILYGVLSHTDSYKKLVEKIANNQNKKEIRFAIILSLLIAVFTSILTNTFALLVFVPFFIHILRRMGFDNLSSFVTVFGSMMVGVIGATYGTDGAVAFTSYLTYGGSEVTILTSLLLRAGILLVAYTVFTFFNIKMLKKQFNKKDANEVKLDNDKFYLGEVKNKKAKVWPIVVVFVILFVLLVLGFVDWNTNFDIEVFADFHEWFMKLAIGGFKVFESIIGGNLSSMGYNLATAFGTWYLFTYATVIGVLTILVALCSKIKFDNLLTYAIEGCKEMAKPIILVTLTYSLFVFVYWSPFVPTIINFVGKLSGNFNPIVTSLQALVAGLFNNDLGYVGYSLSYLLGNYSGNEGNLVFVIYTTIYGLCMMIAPVSMFLLFGLSYLDVPYKKWAKYIWKYLLIMLAVLLVIFMLVAYL